MSSAVIPLPSRPASRAPVWIGGNMPVARLGLILNLLVPLVLLIWDACHGKLGADPVNFATHTTGLIAVTYLLLSLAVTPLRMVTGWSWLVQFRRSLGVFAFYYACAHLAIYFWWDRSRNFDSTVYEITHRYYLTIGFLSLALMAPLWATSFNGAIRAMGATWWKRLHALTYLAAGLACWHLYLQTKADKRRPDVYFAILAFLLLWRLAAWAIKRRQNSSGALPVSAATAREAALNLDQPSVPSKIESIDSAPAVTPEHSDHSTPNFPNATPLTVTFAQSGQSAPLAAGQTLLEAAEAIGVTIDYQCRAGLCGTCRCKLLSGHVTMPVRDALSDEDEANGYILACQALATEDVILDA